VFLEGGGVKVCGADYISWVVVFVVTPCFFEGGRLLSASNPDELETATCFLSGIFSDHVQH